MIEVIMVWLYMLDTVDGQEQQKFDYPVPWTLEKCSDRVDEFLPEAKKVRPDLHVFCTKLKR